MMTGPPIDPPDRDIDEDYDPDAGAPDTWKEAEGIA